MIDNMQVNLSKMIEDEKNNADAGCRRMSKCLAFHKVQFTMIVVCVDAIIAGNKGAPADIAGLMCVFAHCFHDDLFSNKKEFRVEEILEWLNALSSNGIFQLDRKQKLVAFHKDVDPSLLIKDSIEFLEKTVCISGELSTALSLISKHYSMFIAEITKGSDA